MLWNEECIIKKNVFLYHQNIVEWMIKNIFQENQIKGWQVYKHNEASITLMASYI